jgi:ligand-binding sensor domain-containing protein
VAVPVLAGRPTASLSGAVLNPQADQATSSFELVDTNNGLPPDQVGGVQTDASGGVWVNLVRGLYTRSPGAKRFAAVVTSTGIVRVDFRTPIAFLPNGHILFISNGQILELRKNIKTGDPSHI